MTIATDKGKTATKSVTFKIQTQTSGGESGGDQPPVDPVPAGWTVTAPTSTEGLLCKAGTLVYAYAPRAVTADGISFVADPSLANGDFAIAQTSAGVDDNIGNGGQRGDWASLVSHAWQWSNQLNALDVTLAGLEAGSKYLVQVLSHNGWSEVKIGTADEDLLLTNGGLGVSVVGVFTASASSRPSRSSSAGRVAGARSMRFRCVTSGRP